VYLCSVYSAGENQSSEIGESASTKQTEELSKEEMREKRLKHLGI